MQVSVQYDMPYCLYLLPDAMYQVHEENQTATVEIRKCSKSPEEVTRLTGIVATGFFGVPEPSPEEMKRLADAQPGGRFGYSMMKKDRRGIMHYSRVKVIFETDTDPADQMFDLRVRKQSLQFLNKLIEAYRLTADEECAEVLALSDVLKATIDYSKGAQEVHITGTRFPSAVVTGGNQFLQEEELQELRRLIESDKSIPAFHNLIMDGRNYLNKQDYRMAMLCICLGFEMFLTQLSERYRTVLLKAGLSSDEIDDAGLHKKAARHLKIVCGASIENEKFWGRDIVEEYMHIHSLRNAVAHRGVVEYEVSGQVFHVDSTTEGERRVQIVRHLISEIEARS